MNVPEFRAACPVAPVWLTRGVQGFDIKDLDAWIDARKKAGNPAGGE